MGKGKTIGWGCAAVGAGFIGGIAFLVVGGIMLFAQAIASLGEDFAEKNGVYGSAKALDERPLAKRWLAGDGDADAPQIAYVALRGVIAPPDETEDALFGASPSSAQNCLRAIRAATRDDEIKGLVLFLDTPGGTVTESDVLYDALERFKKSAKGRFVLVHAGATCCSGGYYVAAAADCIWAHPTTLTGSIGVIMRTVNVAELAKNVGVKSVVVASGANKALLDPLAPVDPAHVAILKRPVEQDYERFLSIVAKGRKLPVEKVRPLADGRVLSAQDALAAGLIDGIGYAEDVRKKAAELAQAPKVRFYRYDEPFSLRSLLNADVFAKWGRAFFRGVEAAASSSAAPRNEYR